MWLPIYLSKTNAVIGSFSSVCYDKPPRVYNSWCCASDISTFAPSNTVPSLNILSKHRIRQNPVMFKKLQAIVFILAADISAWAARAAANPPSNGQRRSSWSLLSS